MNSFKPNLLINSRLLIILLLGFVSGLPLALVGSTLQAWFTSENISLVTIGTLSLLGAPYTFKFLWAPLMDHYSFPFFGKRRGWILCMQAGLLIALLLMASLSPTLQTKWMGLAALAVAFFSASQDIAIDAYRTDVLNSSELGLGASYFVFSYRLAMFVSGGLALLSAQYLGWKITYQIMAFLVLAAMIPTSLAPNVAENNGQTHLSQTVRGAIRDFLERDKIVLIFLFIIFYKFGDALALSLMTNFLLHGLGFSLSEVGLAYKTVSFVAVILGGFVAGIWLTQMTIYRALLIFGLAQAFSNLTFVLLALAGKNFLLMTSTIFIENFCSGLSTAAFFAFLMSFCDHRYTASQYALLSAVASLGRVLLGPLAGYMVENLGWVQFYIYAFVLCFPGIIFLMLLKNKVFHHASLATD